MGLGIVMAELLVNAARDLVLALVSVLKQLLTNLDFHDMVAHPWPVACYPLELQRVAILKLLSALCCLVLSCAQISLSFATSE